MQAAGGLRAERWWNRPPTKAAGQRETRLAPTRGKGNERKLAKVGSRKDAALDRTLTAGGSVLQAGRLATTLSQARLARDRSPGIHRLIFWRPVGK